jgi:uncharacterized protein with PQ loop repeat
MWQQHPRSSTSQPTDGGVLDKVLPMMSIFTMAMTLPQVWSVWVGQDTAGVSLLSWSAYLVSACLWLIDGLRKHDKTIWVACIGWILMDAAVVIGVLLRR